MGLVVDGADEDEGAGREDMVVAGAGRPASRGVGVAEDIFVVVGSFAGVDTDLGMSTCSRYSQRVTQPTLFVCLPTPVAVPRRTKPLSCFANLPPRCTARIRGCRVASSFARKTPRHPSDQGCLSKQHHMEQQTAIYTCTYMRPWPCTSPIQPPKTHSPSRAQM